MKEIKIEIPKQAIMTEVALASSYAGAKSRETADFDTVATVKEDEAFLQRFWNDTCGEIASVLQEFVAVALFSGESLKLELELSGAYDEALTPSVEADIFSALSAGVTARWFRFTLPEKAPEWETRSRDLLERAHRKLCYRRKPLKS